VFLLNSRSSLVTATPGKFGVKTSPTQGTPSP
jgi:hypothetical protein